MVLPPCSPGFPDGPAQDSSAGEASPVTQDSSADEASPGTQDSSADEASSGTQDSGEDDTNSGGGNDAPGDEEENGAGERACFPGNAQVTLQSGEKVSMRDLRIGSFVLVGKGEYSQIIGFSHSDAYAHTAQVRITLTIGERLTVSGGHYVYANGGIVPARAVSPGDWMRNENGVGVVEDVGKVDVVGLFNPQTAKGDIVVDGFVTSTYTEALSPTMAHALLLPFRAFPGFGEIVSWVGDGWRLLPEI